MFLWFLGTLSSILYLPVVLYFWEDYSWGVPVYLCLFGTAILHLAYFILLQKGYEAGDFSLVYPLARGLGPFLTTVFAILFFGERPGWPALCGVVLVVAGVFFLARNGAVKDRNEAILYGIATGVVVAAYTLWDKYAVSEVGVDPLLVGYFSFLGYMVLPLPYALRRWRLLREKWHHHRWEVLGVAALAPLSYLLVLFAMTFTPVSLVAPVREVSILFGALMGGRFLQEGGAFSRLPAAAAIVIGVVALALA